MKKLFTALLSICLIFSLSACVFDEASLLYSENAEKGGFYIAINKMANCCFVGDYSCTEYNENLEITIPDDYNGIPIKQIGGYYGSGIPTPFLISLADLYMNASENNSYNSVFNGDISELEISENYIVEDVIFNLNIGKNIEVIEFVDMNNYYPHINDDESITFYRAVVNVKCSEENKYFYAENGKLYNKESDELISCFAYASS